MKNIAKITQLYDFYGELLSNKQKKYLEAYYFNDLSLSEIANNEKISRNAVYSSIQDGIKELNYYEKKLKLIVKQGIILKLYDKVNDTNLRNKLISFELSFNKRGS